MKWTDNLNSDVYRRLCSCSTILSDIIPLCRAKWFIMKDKEGYQKEDALVSILELLDCNGCYFDLTRDQYDDILASI